MLALLDYDADGFDMRAWGDAFDMARALHLSPDGFVLQLEVATWLAVCEWPEVWV